MKSVLIFLFLSTFAIVFVSEVFVINKKVKDTMKNIGGLVILGFFIIAIIGLIFLGL